MSLDRPGHAWFLAAGLAQWRASEVNTDHIDPLTAEVLAAIHLRVPTTDELTLSTDPMVIELIAALKAGGSVSSGE
jgi:hypothetical protein